MFGFILSVALITGFIIFVIRFSTKITKNEIETAKLREELAGIRKIIENPDTKALYEHVLEKPKIETAAKEVKIVRPEIKEPEKTVNKDKIENKEINADQIKNQSSFKKEESVKAGQAVKKNKEPGKSLFENEMFKKIVRNFLENWMAVIGVVLLLIGVSVFGVLAVKYFNFGPVHRFIALAAFSALLLAAYFILKRKDFWVNIALWLRSASGAVFLFICFGSFAIPGLKWIDPDKNLIFAYGMLGLGIAANIIIALLGKKQIFASFHGLLSMIPLFIVPKDEKTLVVALIITVIGVIFNFREKWKYHLILTSTCFFAYLVIWRFTVNNIGIQHYFLGLIGVIIVNMLSLVIHYRKFYHNVKFELVPFITHLINWAYLGVGVYLYKPATNLTFIILIAFSVMVLILARLAKKSNIRWLYITDTLMALLTAFIGAVSLIDLKITVVPVFAVLFIESAVFTAVMIIEKEKRLCNTGIILQNVLSLVIVVISLNTADIGDGPGMFYNSLFLLACSLSAVMFNLFVLKKHGDFFKFEEGVISNRAHFIYFIIAGIIILIAIAFNISAIALLKTLNIRSLHPEMFLMFSSMFLIFARNRLENAKLQFADAVLSQAAAFFAVFMLYYTWSYSLFNVIFVLFMEAAVFTLISRLRNDRTLHNIGVFLISVLSFALIAVNYLTVDLLSDAANLNNSIIIFIASAAGLTYGIIRDRLDKTGLPRKIMPLFKKILLSAVILFIFITVFILKFGKAVTLFDFIDVKYLLLISSVIFLMIRYNKSNKVLNAADIIVSQIMVYIAIFFLTVYDERSYLTYEPEFLFVIFLMFMQTVLFTLIYGIAKDRIKTYIGSLLLNITCLYMMIFNFSSGSSSVLFRTVILSIAFAAGSLFNIYSGSMIKGYEEEGVSVKFLKFNFNIAGFFLPLMLLLIYFNLKDALPWQHHFFFKYFGAEFIILIPTLALIYVRNKFQLSGMGIGLFGAVLFYHALYWLAYIYDHGAFFKPPADFKLINTIEVCINSIPLFLMSAYAVKCSFVEKFNKHIKWFGIYLFASHAAFIAYAVLKPFAVMLPGVVWLIMSIAALEIALFLRGRNLSQDAKADLYIMHAGFALLAAFVIRHVLVHLQSEAYLILFFKARLLIEVFAVLVMIYWMFHRKPQNEIKYGSYKILHSLLLELMLFFVILAVGIELKSVPVFYPLCWAALAVFAYLISKINDFKFKRLEFYSLLLYWSSLINLPVVTSIYLKASYAAFNLSNWIAVILSVTAMFFFIGIFHFNKGIKETGNGFFDRIIRVINFKPNLWVYIPLYISIALFIWWAFPKSVLTLLWTIEAFGVFILSIILKENIFRYTSTLMLALCLIRIVFFDLKNSDNIIKVIVLIGVGLLIIIMNVIYNKFKTRFKDEKK